MAGTNMIFKLTGVVYDDHGSPVPNHAIKADLIYWVFVAGVSTRTVDTVYFSTGIAGSYVQWYKGQAVPVASWDSVKGLAVSVSNADPLWTGKTLGLYDGEPTGDSPITIVVSDTVIQLLPPPPPP